MKRLDPTGTNYSGKSAGSVFSKGGVYGKFVRTKAIPKNPQSSEQQTQRAKFSDSSQAWRGLTEDQRLQWGGATENFKSSNVFGESFKYTPSNLFSKVNENLKAAGFSTVLTPPVPGSITNILISSVTANGTTGAIDAVFAPTPIPANHRVKVYATPAVSAGRKFVGNLYNQIGTLAPGATSPADIKAAYEAKFGSIVGKAGMKLSVKFQTVTSTGLIGVESSATTIIV